MYKHTDSSGDVSKHLPYQINEAHNKNHYYETLWKIRGMDLLLRHSETERGMLLDYGSGRGEFVRIAKKKGFDVSGADTDPECVKLTSKYGTASLITSPEWLTGLVDKSLDVISCFHVLEHVPHPLSVLREFRRIARRHILLGVPNLKSLSPLHNRMPFPGQLVVNRGHLHGWDHETLLNLCVNECGLKFIGWTHDATPLPFVSQLVLKLLGTRMLIKCETGSFVKKFPFNCISCIGLFATI